MLWHWKWNQTFARHYPYCITCNRLASDDHLQGGLHLQKTYGTRLSFDFVDRLKHLANGVQFRVGGASHGLIDTTLFLSANTKLPAATDNDEVYKRTTGAIAYIMLQQQGRPGFSQRCRLSADIKVHITWKGTQEPIDDFFCLHANGRARDAFAAVEKPFILKIQDISGGIVDRNKAEYDLYMTSQPIRKIVPQVFGYAQQMIDGKQLSFLLVEKIAFSFSELSLNLLRHDISEVSLMIMKKCVWILVRPERYVSNQ